MRTHSKKYYIQIAIATNLYPDHTQRFQEHYSPMDSRTGHRAATLLVVSVSLPGARHHHPQPYPLCANSCFTPDRPHSPRRVESSKLTLSANY